MQTPTAEASGKVVREEPSVAAPKPAAREAPKTPPRLLGEDDAGAAENRPAERAAENRPAAGKRMEGKATEGKATETKKASPSGQPAEPTPEEGGEEEVVRVSTSLITVPVTVTDRDGKYVTDLRREEFHVFEDGVEQQIAFFEPVERSITVALLLDVSNSTKFRIKEIQEAAIAFLEQLRPEDRVIVVSFDKRVQLLAEATNDRATLVEAIHRLQPGTGTSLFNVPARGGQIDARARFFKSRGFDSAIFVNLSPRMRKTGHPACLRARQSDGESRRRRVLAKGFAARRRKHS